MNASKFVDLLDNEQKRRDSQYVDYLNIIKMCDYHYQQQQYSSSIFCNQLTNQNSSIYGPSKHIEPIKLIRAQSDINLLSTSLFDTSLYITKSPKILPEISPESLIKKTKKIDIDVDIQCISDLISIVENYTYESDTEYNIDLKALVNIKEELITLNSMIGLQHFKKQILDQLLYFVQNLHKDSESDFMHTVLCGPPGTGKTEIATILGKMYSKLGILKKNTFKMVNRSDLVAGYLGQTAIKTSKVIEEALGGCLFIDEAYSLANNYEGDSFTRECIDTLCESLSKHKGELMVIIAGYKDELENTFFKANKGMDSRFIWRFYLEKYNYKELIAIFKKKTNDNKWILEIDDTDLNKWFQKNSKVFKHFGRDIEQLFSYIKISHGRRIYGKSPELRKHIIMVDLENGFKQFNDNNLKQETPELIGLYV
jgi:SpoVK/Ycf46/Vps4 family AAA+-type ATPase